jgi:hypothetical protein
MNEKEKLVSELTELRNRTISLERDLIANEAINSKLYFETADYMKYMAERMQQFAEAIS